MERADLSRPGANLRAGADPRWPEEVARLHQAFARMLERLEAERRRASSAALTAQEQERARVARDLHDEVNQSLTGLLLRLEAARKKAPPELAGELGEIRALANQAMEELLTLARQLRPTALDDLGLEAALAGNVRELTNQGVVRAELRRRRRALGAARGRPAGRLPGRPGGALERRPPRERRARAGRAAPRGRPDRAQRLRRRCAGSPSIRPPAGSESAGMRERALLVGGEFQIESRPGIGTRVRLLVPIGTPDADSGGR